MFSGCVVTLMVDHFDAAIRFYVETLGFELLGRYGDHFAEVSVPGFTLGLHLAEHPLGPAGNRFSLGFGVTDFDQTVSTLRDRGVAFDSEVQDEGNLRIANFHDPEGNLLYLAASGG